MKNFLSPNHSINKKNLKQIKIYPDPKRNIVSSPRDKSTINNISEICNSIYEDYFPYILKLSKIQFFEKFNKEADEIFFSGKFKTSHNIKFVIDSKENIYKRYDKDYKYLSEEYQKFRKNPKNFKFLTHFRKHCIDTDYYAFHYCSKNKKGKFIEIKNPSSNNNEVSYVICEQCKQCYLSKYILMLCNHCYRKYFSNILKDNEDGNILPATWKKYHCNSLINAIMKCIKCKKILYYNLTTKTLVCLNKNCNFNSKPESILWTCNTCNQEFRSPAKIYNPLEFQILNKSINYALLKQIKAAPRELPCHCTKNLSKLIFYHKEECRGELYKGILIDRPMLVCNKCKAINFEEKFTWTCPICTVRFHLHRVTGCKPFSKKKYIINKSFNKSLRNFRKGKLDKEMLQRNLLSSSISIKKDVFINKSVNNSDRSNLSKVQLSEDLNNISTFNTNNYDNINDKLYKKVEPNRLRYNRNEEEEKGKNKNYNYKKKCWLINLKKGRESSNSKKRHSTLLDILQERKNSESKKDKENESKRENDKFNRTMLPPKRLINHNLIKRRKDIILNEQKDKTEKNKYNNINKRNGKKIEIKTEKIFSKSLNNIEKEDKRDKRFLKNKISYYNNVRNEQKEKKNLIKIKFDKRPSPFRSDISLKNRKNEKDKKENIRVNNDKSINAMNETNNLSVYKNIGSNDPLKSSILNNSNSFTSSLQIKSSKNNNNSSPLSSFRYLKIRKYTDNNESIENSNNNLRFSKINDLLTSNKLETEPSYNDNNIDINISGNSSFRLSFAVNNSLVKQNNNIFNYNNEKKEVDEIKEKESSIIFSEKNNKKINDEEKGDEKENEIEKEPKKEEEKEEQKVKEKEEKEEDKEEQKGKENEKEEEKEDQKEKEKEEEKEGQKEKEKEEKEEEQKEGKDKEEKEKERENESESEENNYSDENNDKIDDLKKLIKKDQNIKENEEKNDIFNDSDLYEKNDGVSSEEGEDKDTIKDLVFNSSAKKNFRESLMLKSTFTRQSILISQDKLNSLAIKTDIPTINESDYSYLKPIGEGTYGSVYLVEHNVTSEQFALKKIICRDYNELIKQKNELELIFSVKHENILKLYGIQFKYLDETTSAIFVLMELAQNDWSKEIRRRIIAKRYYKELELVHLLKQIIKGFLFLQDKNIAHRDIKPQNILLFPKNVYKIADFGEAKFVKNIAEQSTLRGSELYMSPLLYKGYKFNQKNVLHNPFKSDVFSLGFCLLYAMCLNLKVLEAVRELTTMKSIISHISKYMIANKYSDKLINIVYKMIEPNEDLRYGFEDLNYVLDKL